MNELKHIIVGSYDSTLCWYSGEQLEKEDMGWWINDKYDWDDLKEFILENKCKMEYWSNCKSCIEALKELRSIRK